MLLLLVVIASPRHFRQSRPCRGARTSTLNITSTFGSVGGGSGKCTSSSNQLYRFLGTSLPHLTQLGIRFAFVIGIHWGYWWRGTSASAWFK
jgi:hypothetical protein